MINQMLYYDVKNSRLPKRIFSAADKEYCRNKITLKDFCEWFDVNHSLFAYKDSVLCVKENTDVQIPAGKIFAHNFKTEQSFGFYGFCQAFLSLGFYAATFAAIEFKNDLRVNVISEEEKYKLVKQQIENDLFNEKIKVDRSCKEMYAFLCNTRKISKEVIFKLLNTNDLYVEEYKNNINVCFPFRNLDNEIVGFEKRGCNSFVKMTSVCTSEKSAYYINSFFYDSNEEFHKLICFESCLDMIAFISLIYSGKIKINCSLLLLSLRGLNNSIAEKCIDDLKKQDIHIDDIYIATDDDEKSHEFITRHNYSFTSCSILNEYGCKDWNDMLKVEINEVLELDDIFI